MSVLKIIFRFSHLISSFGIITTSLSMGGSGNDMFNVISERGGIGREDLLSNSVGGRLSSRSLRVNKHAVQSRLKWSVDEDGKGLYLAQGSGGWAVTGHSERIGEATGGLISITSPEFVALTSTTLDDADLYGTKNVLVTACGRCENTGMKF